MNRLIVAVYVLLVSFSLSAKEYHVAKSGKETNPGTKELPLLTIQAAAEKAQPGDIITVHEGVYRERVDPPRGGTSHDNRIVYRAARGEDVTIKGSEVVKSWQHVDGGVWKATIQNSFFGDYNPYNTLIEGHWFNARGRDHYTGAVYLNGEWLIGAASLEDVMNRKDDMYWWFARVDEEQTTIWADFNGANPNKELVEINVRKAVFYPSEPGRNYITVRGFTMRQAATPWAPPTTEQVGLIGTHWSKGWIIENNVISHSRCVGITLGKYDDTANRPPGELYQPIRGTAEGYKRVIRRAMYDGWSRKNVGSHVVRNNTISHCEAAGLVGSLGGIFSEIYGNTIHDIYRQGLWSGGEMAGIKLHGPIATLIRDNRIYRTICAIWLDWMSQHARVTGNLCYDNRSDFKDEVNCGPVLIDNNLFLSGRQLINVSEGAAYVHNLIVGGIRSYHTSGRSVPYFEPYSTDISGESQFKIGDDRYYNNIFTGGEGLGLYDEELVELELKTGGNVFLNGAKPPAQAKDPLVQASFDPELKVVENNGVVYVEFKLAENWAEATSTGIITTRTLGTPRITGLPYTGINGEPLRFDIDYMGNRRDEASPCPGPIEPSKYGSLRLKVWPKD